jgi:hypothetical protein
MIIQDTAHLKSFVPVTNDFKYEDIQPFLNSTLDEYLIPYISSDLYALLDISDLTSLSTELKDLLPYAQAPLAWIALYKYSFSADKLIGIGGITTNETDGAKMVAQWRMEDLREYCLKEYDASIDRMLTFLEENSGDYAAWANSSAYTSYKQYFINTTTVFDQHFRIGKSRRTFKAMSGLMQMIEKMFIRPITGDDLFDEIKEQIVDDDLSEENETLLDYIVPAVAKLTGARALLELPVVITDGGAVIRTQSSTLTQNATDQAPPQLISSRIQLADSDGRNFLEQLKQYLYNNHGDYPLYEADSSVYISGTNTNINANNGTFFF